MNKFNPQDEVTSTAVGFAAIVLVTLGFAARLTFFVFVAMAMAALLPDIPAVWVYVVTLLFGIIGTVRMGAE